MDIAARAWAAGFFDGEGSVSTFASPRGATTVRISVSQASRDGVPGALSRFQAAVGGHGTIVGPYRGYLYYWHTKSVRSIEEVSTTLWPQLGMVKRQQLIRRLNKRFDLRPFAAALDADDQIAARCWALGVAWAAGFFEAEGTVGAYIRPGHRRIAASIAQASASEVPDVLVRFHAAVLGLGAVSGPRFVPSPWSRLPQYRWACWRFEHVQALVALLWPWLGERKRAQSAMALTKWRGWEPVSRRSV